MTLTTNIFSNLNEQKVLKYNQFIAYITVNLHAIKKIIQRLLINA